MNKSEILETIRDPDRLNSLAEGFRQSRDVLGLLALLDSENEEIVRAGVWIAGEVKFDPSTAGPLLARLYQLLNHENPSIRFHAIGGLFPFFDSSNSVARHLLRQLSTDTNEGVRIAAQSALSRMGAEEGPEPKGSGFKCSSHK